MEAIDEATLNALLLVQKQAFQFQAKCLHEVLNEQKLSPADLSVDYAIPNVLIKRHLNDDFRSQNRLIDNEEATILGILDGAGNISLKSRLSDFMVLLTRLTKIDHRAIAIKILTDHVTNECQMEFVATGGYRILKRWIKVAEDDNNVDELIALVRLIKKLPFDDKAAKVTEIGKTINKLQKLKIASPSLPVLVEEVKSIKELWMKLMKEKSESKESSAKSKIEDLGDNSIVPYVLTINERLMADKPSARPAVPNAKEAKATTNGKAPTADIPPKPVTKAPSAPLAELVDLSVSDPSSKNAVSADESKVSVPASEEQPKPAPHPIRKPGALINVIESLKSKPTLPVPTAAPAQGDGMDVETSVDLTADKEEPIAMIPALPKVPSIPGFMKGLPRGERKPTDMAEGARKLLRKRAQQQAKASVADEVESKSSITDSASEALKIAIPLGRGGLKKKAMTPGGGGGERKLSVQWADEHGGMLRDVFTIEVEKIKSTVANYKSHKDLVKKERQLEKETHLSKFQDAMHKNTEWRTLIPLTFSIEVLENSNNPVVSPERDIQTKRLQHVLEVRFLDDSLIPENPDDPPLGGDSSSEEYNPFAVASREEEPVCADIPWYQEGAEPVVESMDRYDVGGGSSSVPMSESQLSLVASLPIAIQRLEPVVLQRIVQQPRLLNNVLRNDGSVDESLLMLLRRDILSQSQPQDLQHQPRAGSRWGATGDILPPSHHDLFAPREMMPARDFPSAPSLQLPPPRSNPPPLISGSKNVKFPTSKSSVACRFFNTPKGCQFGDKCEFGHFLGISSGVVVNNELLDVPPGARAGPGSRQGGIGTMSSMGMGMGMLDNPMKRLRK